MKRIILLALILFTGILFAQDGERIKQMKAMKTAFITTELDLSPQEAEKFWPIYNQYEQKNFELKAKRLRSIMKEIKDKKEAFTEKEAQAKLQEIISLEDEINALEKKLLQDLKPVLSADKILKLKIAEMRFQQTVLNRLRDGKGPR